MKTLAVLVADDFEFFRKEVEGRVQEINVQELVDILKTNIYLIEHYTVSKFKT